MKPSCYHRILKSCIIWLTKLRKCPSYFLLSHIISSTNRRNMVRSIIHISTIILVFCMSCVWQLLNKRKWWWWRWLHFFINSLQYCCFFKLSFSFFCIFLFRVFLFSSICTYCIFCIVLAVPLWRINFIIRHHSLYSLGIAHAWLYGGPQLPTSRKPTTQQF